MVCTLPRDLKRILDQRLRDLGIHTTSNTEGGVSFQTQWFRHFHLIKGKVSARHCPLQGLDVIPLRIQIAICDGLM